MTDRDIMATAILQGCLAGGDGKNRDFTTAREEDMYWRGKCRFAYRLADQMNKAREES